MSRHLLPLVVLVALLSTHAQGGCGAGPGARSARPARHGRRRQPEHRVGFRFRGAARHRPQDGGPDHRVPPEERAVQEDRRADERPRHRREELSEAQAAAHGGVGRAEASTARQALAVTERHRWALERQLDTRWWSSPWCLASRSRPRRPLCPRMLTRLDEARVAGATRYLAARFYDTRIEAITRLDRSRDAIHTHERRFHLRGLRRRQRKRRPDPRHRPRTSTVSSTRRSSCPASSAAWTSGRCRACRRSTRAARRQATIRSGSAPATW